MLYCATENPPMYLYKNWAHATDGAGDCATSSQYLSGFLKRLGKDEGSRDAFWRAWANLHGKNWNLVFDISSISTYSNGLTLDEFGYNRDGESLPQINIGMLFADRPGQPLGYKVYSGSIANVSTLKNLLHHMKRDYFLTHSRLILDRGFYSASNLTSLNSAGDDFIIPLPLSLGAVMSFRLKTSGGKLRMSFPEMISHLKRLKEIYSEDGSSIPSEMTKKQKCVFSALKITPNP